MKLQNVVEYMARRAVDQTIDTVGCCRCEQCRLDMAAIALNNLKPHYVVSTLGEALTVNAYLTAQKQAEVLSEVIKAIAFVSQNPRHT